MSDKPFINNDQAQALITRLLTEDQFAGKVSEDTLDAFDSMQSRELPLSAKQILWVQGVAVRLGLVEEPATNEWSSKTLQERERIRGRDVPTPAALQNKALRPPHRLHELEKK